MVLTATTLCGRHRRDLLWAVRDSAYTGPSYSGIVTDPLAQFAVTLFSAPRVPRDSVVPDVPQERSENRTLWDATRHGPPDNVPFTKSSRIGHCDRQGSLPLATLDRGHSMEPECLRDAAEWQTIECVGDVERHRQQHSLRGDGLRSHDLQMQNGVDRPARNPSRTSDSSGPTRVRCWTMRAVTTLSNSLRTSFSSTMGLKPTTDVEGLPGFGSSTIFPSFQL
ncbi:unnamed protein product [Euphydryas editha]|uniref:Uncharacterized protein n=1 Tax=Euphydryas editha TaxID=104508 RepID=A0AAU9V9N7_EUPED|nr:unnamed protein product [Euphydryas editha]